MAKPETKAKPSPTRRPITPPRGACLIAGPRFQATMTGAAMEALSRPGVPILACLVSMLDVHRASGQRRTRHPIAGDTILHVLSAPGGTIIAAASDFASEEKAA